MSEKYSWADQWFKAQQQFVDAWTDMAKSASVDKSSQTDLWSRGFDMWRQALGGQGQPDAELAMRKCMDMGREYFAMAEQVGKGIADGGKPTEAINQWLEQLKQALQQFSGMPSFNGANVNDFMKQWFTPTQSWQQMVAALAPMQQATWQMPGMNTSVFNMGEAIDPMGKVLSAPGIGYFREPQEKQQKGMQLALEYNEANFKFNQAFLRVALESIQGFQQKLMQIGPESMPKSLRQLYDLWVEVSEEHYAEFAMSDEYQTLYGDMVNRLMVMKKHYHDIAAAGAGAAAEHARGRYHAAAPAPAAARKYRVEEGNSRDSRNTQASRFRNRAQAARESAGRGGEKGGGKKSAGEEGRGESVGGEARRDG
ncbi:MAG TPA: poly(R)-hydroxyalkanoic acid synthase subunit PhaE [Gammaproteobacteria bacterium]